MTPRPSPDLAATVATSAADTTTTPSEPADETGGSSRTKGERTYRRLLELAVKSFGANGYRGTSVSAIARAAGLTQPTAYAYFANKESLFMAAVDADATTLVLGSHAAVGSLPTRTRFRAFLVELYLRLDDHPLTRRVLAGEEPDVLPRLIDLPAIRMATKLIVGDMRAGQASGQIRVDVDVEILGDGIEAIILSLLIASVQSDGMYVPRYQAGIYAAFDAMLKPPS